MEPFKALQNEVEALQRVVLVAQGHFYNGSGDMTFIAANYDIAVPRFDLAGVIPHNPPVPSTGTRMPDVPRVIVRRPPYDLPA